MKPLNPTSEQLPRWPLWSVLWRTLLVWPILAPLGVVVFVAAIASIAGPPIYAVTLVLDGNWFFAPVVLGLWVIWLPYGCRLVRWLYHGSEYSSL